MTDEKGICYVEVKINKVISTFRNNKSIATKFPYKD